MPTFATDADLLEYEPQIKQFGISEYTTEHEKTYEDIVRLLNIRWFPTTDFGRYDLTISSTTQLKLDTSKLDPSQFVRAAVYHTLAYYIYPKLSTFEETDVFTNKRVYYKEKFEEEFDLILRAGVHYDIDSSGTYEDGEKKSFYNGRLIR
jgi:hypothetical protein